MKSVVGVTQPAEPIVPRTTRGLIGMMVKPFRWGIFGFLLSSLVGTIAWTASPLVIAQMVTDLSKNTTINSQIWWLVAIYTILRLIDESFWRLAEFTLRSFLPQMVENVRLNLFAAVLKKPHAFFVNSSSGRIGHWINRATETANDFVDTTAWSVWGRSIGLLLSAAFLFTIHWTVVVLFLSWLILLFGYNIYRGRQFGQLVELQSNETSKAAGMVVDSISNHVSVRVFNAQQSERKLLAGQQNRIIKTWRDSWRQNLVTNVYKGQSAAAISTIGLGLVLYLYSHGSIGLGAIVLFLAYFGDAGSSLWGLADALDRYYRQFGTIQNALDNLQGENERHEDVMMPTQQAGGLTLRLDDVSFFYPDHPTVPVLSNLNLIIKPGEKVGIVGHSGAGKSTLVGLLLGFYEPSSGEILLNGESTATHGPSLIRSLSSFVPQDTNLFNRTVRENIVYSSPDVSEEVIQAALRQARADEFVQKLPHGLDTMIGERGVKLSGGQRQRLAIARAIIHNAPLLILDEATSALDSVSEQAIQKALSELMQHRTSVVIAHRLSTLKHLDTIIVLDQGEIAEKGSHTELVALNGIYADLWRRQKDGFVGD